VKESVVCIGFALGLGLALGMGLGWGWGGAGARCSEVHSGGRGGGEGGGCKQTRGPWVGAQHSTARHSLL
jgi:hypothetical protein